jgi:hypothetical protein
MMTMLWSGSCLAHGSNRFHETSYNWERIEFAMMPWAHMHHLCLFDERRWDRNEHHRDETMTTTSVEKEEEAIPNNELVSSFW